MSVLISVPIVMAISQYSNLNHACELVTKYSHWCFVVDLIPTYGHFSYSGGGCQVADSQGDFSASILGFCAGYK